MTDLTCKLTADLLPLYADDLLSPESRQYVEAHLKTCGSCRGVLEAVRSAPLLQYEPELDTGEEDRMAAGLADRLKEGVRRLQFSAAADGLTILGFFLLYWKVLGRVWSWLFPMDTSWLLALLVVFLGAATAASVSARALQRGRAVLKRWILVGLAVAVVWVLVYPGPVLTQQSMLWVRDCGSGVPYRSAGAVPGWYLAPGAPFWQRQRAYRVEYTCPAAGEAGGLTRHLRWAGARTDFTLEAGQLTPVRVVTESGRPLRVETPEGVRLVEAVQATWTQAVGAAAETYHQVRLTGGEELTLLFDPLRGEWHRYDRQVPPRGR